MRHRTLAFIDLEMTGLEPHLHEIIEIGLVLAEQSQNSEGKITLSDPKEYEWKVLPEHIETADMESLAIAQYKPDEWENAIPLKEALTEFSQLAKDAIMVGHNVSHDYLFLHAGFVKNNMKDTMHYHKLDTVGMAFTRLYSTIEVEKFSLRKLCEYYGIENKKAHTALSDARATYELFKKIMI